VGFLKQYEILYKKARTDLKVAKNILEDFENGDDELDIEVWKINNKGKNR